MKIPLEGQKMSNRKFYRKKKGVACPNCKEARNVRLARIHAECYSCETCGAIFDKDTGRFYFPRGEKQGNR